MIVLEDFMTRLWVLLIILASVVLYLAFLHSFEDLRIEKEIRNSGLSIIMKEEQDKLT